MKSRAIICTVPDLRKANAVAAVVNGSCVCADTSSVPYLLSMRCNQCCVSALPANLILNAASALWSAGPVTNTCPASILQQHDNTLLFLDAQSASPL